MKMIWNYQIFSAQLFQSTKPNTVRASKSLAILIRGYNMDWIDVNSSRVSSVAYDIATQELVLRFPDGTIYGYSCEPDMLDRLLNSDSIGKFVNTVLANLNYRRR